MRVFIGIKAAADLQGKIKKWQKTNANLNARFISADNLHITLVPPWYEKDVNLLVKRIRKFKSPLAPFNISFQTIALNPISRPRVIWAEGTTVTEIIKLKREVTLYLKRPEDKRGFKTHITIARFAKNNKNSIPHIKDAINWTMKVSNFSVFESLLKPSGAEYKILESIDI